jgi:transposase
MKYYVGIDLHSNNSYIVIIDENDKVYYSHRVPNELSEIEKALLPYGDDIFGIVVESTYNWYWLVDGLQERGYTVHLANTSANKQYSGLKNTNDKTDAFWLAHLLRLNILSEGHIYPAAERGLRELTRRRTILVRQQTRVLVGIQAMITRYQGIRLTGNKIKSTSTDDLLQFINDHRVKIAIESAHRLLDCFMREISVLEKSIVAELKENPAFWLLQTIPGIGPVLAMTILLEIGDISRFKQVGHFGSYSRCVESKRVSNEKKKGENNGKNGNAYLSWAFMEAATFAIRFSEPIKKYYQRRLTKKLRVVVLKTIAHKLARACYFMLREEVAFDVNKAFS